ncbi:hypothetical protein ACHAXS_004283 [Conticribra weissflogii]
MTVSIHQDCAAALVLTEILPPLLTLQSKCYVIKMIWLQKEIMKHRIKLHKNETAVQLCDILIKAHL